MKKITLSVALTMLVLMGTGCLNNNESKFKSLATSSPEVSLGTDVGKPDLLEWRAETEVQDRIYAQLRSGKRIHEIVNPRNLSIPSDIYPPQFVKYFALSDMQFGIVQVLSGVTLGGWDQKTTNASGVWYADKSDTAWKPLIILAHAGDYAPLNNIFDFWNENTQLKILLIDSYGGGSGEGNAKIITSSKLEDSWKIEQCFSYAGELYDLQRKLGISTIHDTIPFWLNRKINTEYGTAKAFIFNSSTGKFQITYKDTNNDEVIEIPECQNVYFP